MIRNSLAATQSVAAERQRPSNLCRDRFVDKSYFKDGSGQSQYLKAPWRHCKRPLDSYLSLRFAEKETFLEQLKEISESDWDCVHHEVRRIDNDRVEFQKNPSKNILNSEIRDSYLEWKKAVFNPSEIRQIRQDRGKQLKKQPMSDVHKKILNHWDLMHLKQLEATEELPESNQQAQVEDFNTEHVTVDPYHGFKAGAMYFERCDDGTLKGIDSENEGYRSTKFPNQNIALGEILNNSDNNPLRQKAQGEIRLFHFPSNNMEWIEKAIKQYYGGRHLSKDGQRLLSREYWTGQMQSSVPREKTTGKRRIAALMQSRHMRSKCLLVPRDGRQSFPTRSSPKTSQVPIPVDLPFAGKNIAIFLPYMHWETSSRRAQMMHVINQETEDYSKKPTKQMLYPEALEYIFQEKKDRANERVPSRLKRRKYLARYLLAIARVAEALEHAADERLLREGVKSHSPLHARRTLDQYYYLPMDATLERDRDQIVYRETRSFTSVTRVLMVDQLWLWILDDDTIITSFPGRWGTNMSDPSDVYTSLRMRLDRGTDEIKSIHHLAMMIVDQCSRVFFDRSQPFDQRPEVMGLLAAAISMVNERLRLSYDHFWGSILRNPNYSPTNVLNPEGTLLREAQRIVKELMIMKRIHTEQIVVAKQFMRHLTRPHRMRTAVLGDPLLKHSFITEPQKATAKMLENKDYDLLDLETRIDTESAIEAHDLLELLQDRLAEIEDLEGLALRPCAELESLLSLKHQQTSIVDAKTALYTANESYKQGRTIQALTIVTIVFLPLSFIAAFFGMNNWEINEAPWMSLGQQVNWMFGGTAVVIVISITVAFGAWFRDLTHWLLSIPIWMIAVLRLVFEVLWASFFSWTWTKSLRDWQAVSFFNRKNVDRKRESILANIARKRRERLRRWIQEKEEEEAEFMLTRMPTALLPGYDAGRDADDMLGSDEKKGIIQRMTRLRWAPGKANGAVNTSV